MIFWRRGPEASGDRAHTSDLFALVQQVRRPDAERFRQVVQPQQGEIDAAVFDLAEVGLRESGYLAKRLLFDRPLSPKPGDILPDKRADVHQMDCRG